MFRKLMNVIGVDCFGCDVDILVIFKLRVLLDVIYDSFSLRVDLLFLYNFFWWCFIRLENVNVEKFVILFVVFCCENVGL